MRPFHKILIAVNNGLGLKRMALSPSLAEQMSLQDEEELIVHIGKRQVGFLVKLQPSGDNQNIIFLHPDTIYKLYLKAGREYGYLISGKELRLGPMVGIMIEVLGGSGKLYAEQTMFIKSLIASGQEIGEICYAFSPYAIDWQHRTVTGYTYDKGGWNKRIFPFPDIIYPRERSYTFSSLMIRVRKKFVAVGVKFINPPMAGKWVSCQTIKNYPLLAVHLPDTRLLTNFRVVEDMVKKYKAVYLKPVIGSKGQNIIRVASDKPNKGYQYQYQRNKASVRGAALTINQLKASLQGVMGRRDYLAQQPIDLLTFKGQVTDVRVIVQKDHTGKWGITGLACRMGSAGSITSNLSSGGRGAKLSTVLERHFYYEEQRREIEKEVRFLSLESARVLEEVLGTAGEMGIDLGIDVNGDVWFIEANLRPARHIFLHINEPHTRHRSVINPLLYSRYLAGFMEKEYDK